MAAPTRYVKGDWKVLCDACGRSFLSTDLRKRWDGMMVCSRDWETRHPQDFVRAKIDIQASPWTRPQSSDTFIYAFAGVGLLLLEDGISALLAEDGTAIGIDQAIIQIDPVPPGTFTP